MSYTLPLDLPAADLAGRLDRPVRYRQTLDRINFLLDRYLSLEKLSDRLQDLPVQFANPQPRPWKSIDWQAIDRHQIVGIDFDVFLAIVAGAMDTEAPIRGYTQTSRQYLQNIHPQMARFVGGTASADGSLLELGLWEKEERQHTPALLKIYSQLSGQKIAPTCHQVRGYQPTADPHEDLYRHGLHRVATEFGATCLYLWLMAHTTRSLQVILEELAQDEINHMTKFWGFGVWAFPDTSIWRIGGTLVQTLKLHSSDRSNHGSLIRTWRRMMQVLHWQSWSLTNKATFFYTCTLALKRLWGWSHSLTADDLQALFGDRPAKNHQSRS